MTNSEDDLPVPSTPNGETDDETRDRSNADPDGSDDTSAVIPTDVLDSLPPEVRVQVQSVLAMGGTSGNPLISKLSSRHIDELIALSSKEVDRTGDDRLSSRRYSFALAVVVLVAVFAFALVLSFKDKDDLLIELLKMIGFGAGGFLGGWGFGRSRG